MIRFGMALMEMVEQLRKGFIKAYAFTKSKFGQGMANAIEEYNTEKSQGVVDFSFDFRKRNWKRLRETTYFFSISQSTF